MFVLYLSFVVCSMNDRFALAKTTWLFHSTGTCMWYRISFCQYVLHLKSRWLTTKEFVCISHVLCVTRMTDLHLQWTLPRISFVSMVNMLLTCTSELFCICRVLWHRLYIIYGCEYIIARMTDLHLQRTQGWIAYNDHFVVPIYHMNIPSLLCQYTWFISCTCTLYVACLTVVL